MLMSLRPATLPVQPIGQPAPVQPPTSPPVVRIPGQADIAVPGQAQPLTASGVAALRAQREELSNQLISAQGRRNDANRDLNKATNEAARTGIEQRIIVLDDRIVQLERDIASTGQELSNSQLGAGTDEPSARFGPFSSGQLTGISIVSIVLVWAPLAFALGRVMLKRWGAPKPAPQILESAARLERMEQAMDAVAIEVERISEGQRFVTQLMAKQQGHLLDGGSAPAEPVSVRDAK